MCSSKSSSAQELVRLWGSVLLPCSFRGPQDFLPRKSQGPEQLAALILQKPEQEAEGISPAASSAVAACKTAAGQQPLEDQPEELR